MTSEPRSQDPFQPPEADNAAPQPPSPQETPVPASLRSFFRIAGCGLLMGSADIIPGVSGGTVALIVGVYERLIRAISRCDVTFLKLLVSRQFRHAAERIDFFFLMALGTGIAVGIGGLASLMNYVLQHHMALTFAAFSGMILASSLLVARRIPSWNMQHLGLLVLGVTVALRIVTLDVLQNPPDSLWYLFFCGTVGITAMILPGISGAFILLLLGRYHQLTDVIREVLHGNISTASVLTVGVFAAGCVTGLLAFSRFLRWLLEHYHDGTMAMLCGFMIGSLYKLWPFQTDLTPEVEKFRHKIFEPHWPRQIDSTVLLAGLLALTGILIVLGLDAVARHRKAIRQQAASA